MNLVQMLALNARKYGEDDCLRYEGQSYSYAWLAERARAAAGLLQSWGVAKGDRVAVMSYNTPSYVVSFYGALSAGASVVPVNHKLAAPEVDYILGHSQAKVLLIDGALAPVAAKLTAKSKVVALGSAAEGLELFDDLLADAPAATPVEVADGDIAEILYTSGTTGKPKGCLHSHANVIAAGITGALCMQMDSTDRLLMAMPIWHSSPLNNWFMGAQYVGACTVLIREYHPLHFLQAVQAEKCTVYFGAPISYLMPLSMIPNFAEFDLSSMRCWIYGGGPISAPVAKQLMAAYKSDRFYQVYGMTEAGPTGTVLFPREQLDHAGSIGKRALPGADLKVMINEAREAGPGDVGEIWLKADSMMLGYLDNPEATATAFHESWYRTGDVARLDDSGYLFIVDRTKDMIVTGGENVYSKEVEDAIAAHQAVAEAAVVGRPHTQWGETVVAYVVIKPEASLDEEGLTTFLADRLARFKVPREVRFVEALPHTPTGKVQKFQLRRYLQS